MAAATRTPPPEVEIKLVMAARRGDPAAFARMIEHWDAHLRPFVHHVLGGEGSTDRALSAAYVRAYRALPRYDASQRPGLWLHRIAYLAATDELRRVARDPARRRALADAGPSRTHADDIFTPTSDIDPTADDEVESAIIEARALMGHAEETGTTGLPAGWKALAPDQRALAVLVDLEGHTIKDAARTLDATTERAADRLEATRRLLARVGGVSRDGADSTEDVVEASEVGDLIGRLPVPPAPAGFWPMLGRRLLAERAAPAAAAIDPRELLARTHPSEPGFHPDPDAPTNGVGTSVRDLAVHAGRVRPRRDLRRAGVIVIVLVVVAALVAVAVKVGTSSRVPDGTVAAAELAPKVSNAMADGSFRRVRTAVTETDATGRRTERRYQLVLADDGSWAVSTEGTIDQTTYDVTDGLLRRVAVIGQGENAEVFATDATGLAAGSPDPGPTEPVPLDDLGALPSLLRSAGQTRMNRATLGESAVYTLEADRPTGPRDDVEHWTVSVAASTSLPVEIVRREGDREVRRIRVLSWTTTPEVPAASFRQPIPDGARSTSATSGFTATDLTAVPLLGRGDAVNPGWLPGGFEMTVVAVRAEAPSGIPSTGAGRNPADVAVLSLGYQRGPERIVVTTRAAGTDPTAWVSPFTPGPGTPKARSLGDGMFNGARVEVSTDARGRSHLWGVSGDTVFTVAGDVTPDQAARIAASLR